jgi:hypothetical protein
MENEVVLAEHVLSSHPKLLLVHVDFQPIQSE